MGESKVNGIYVMNLGYGKYILVTKQSHKTANGMIKMNAVN
jgi:hypothetical protein